MTTSHSRATSGTTRPAARQMSGRGYVFALTDEVRSLRSELDHTSGGRAAKTLAKTDGLRVTLVLLTSGATLNPESTAAAPACTCSRAECACKLRVRSGILGHVN